MLSLKGKTIYLRALEPSDLDFLYHLENTEEIWEISGTVAPYSKFVLKQYLDNAHRDIYDVKQLRLCICDLFDRPLGLIDLFDFDPKNRRAGLGIVVLEAAQRNKGVGSEAIALLCDYAFSTLQLNQVFANVLETNAAAIHLFKKLGFLEAGTKKQWVFFNGTYKDEVMFQKLKG